MGSGGCSDQNEVPSYVCRDRRRSGKGGTRCRVHQWKLWSREGSKGQRDLILDEILSEEEEARTAQATQQAQQGRLDNLGRGGATEVKLG